MLNNNNMSFAQLHTTLSDGEMMRLVQNENNNASVTTAANNWSTGMYACVCACLRVRVTRATEYIICARVRFGVCGGVTRTISTHVTNFKIHADIDTHSHTDTRARDTFA